jgi:hypothetical protein
MQHGYLHHRRTARFCLDIVFLILAVAFSTGACADSYTYSIAPSGPWYGVRGGVTYTGSTTDAEPICKAVKTLLNADHYVLTYKSNVSGSCRFYNSSNSDLGGQSLTLPDVCNAGDKIVVDSNGDDICKGADTVCTAKSVTSTYTIGDSAGTTAGDISDAIAASGTYSCSSPGCTFLQTAVASGSNGVAITTQETGDHCNLAASTTGGSGSGSSSSSSSSSSGGSSSSSSGSGSSSSSSSGGSSSGGSSSGGSSSGGSSSGSGTGSSGGSGSSGSGSGGGGGTTTSSSSSGGSSGSSSGGTSSSSGGWTGTTCASGDAPTCTGDAVQCAIAKQQWQVQCDLQGTTTTQADLGNNIVNGSDPQQDKLPTPDNGTTSDLSNSIDQSTFLGGACPAAYSFSILGASVTWNIVGACDVLRSIGLAGVVASLLTALFIVFR